MKVSGQTSHVTEVKHVLKILWLIRPGKISIFLMIAIGVEVEEAGAPGVKICLSLKLGLF